MGGLMRWALTARGMTICVALLVLFFFSGPVLAFAGCLVVGALKALAVLFVVNAICVLVFCRNEPPRESE